MKRIVALILALALAMSFAACKSTGGAGKTSSIEKVDHAVNVKSYAKKGEIPEMSVKLGMKADEVIKTVNEENGFTEEDYNKMVTDLRSQGIENPDDYIAFYADPTDMGEYTVIKMDNARCFYKNEKENKGISVMTMLGTAYGFDSNTHINYVKGAIDADFVEDAPDEAALMFLPASNGQAKRLTYTFGDYSLQFFFTDYDILSATVLINTKYWN